MPLIEGYFKVNFTFRRSTRINMGLSFLMTYWLHKGVKMYARDLKFPRLNKIVLFLLLPNFTKYFVALKIKFKNIIYQPKLFNPTHIFMKEEKLFFDYFTHYM